MSTSSLDFLRAVSFLMGRIGEEVTVTVGSVDPASIVVQLRGTLASAGSDVFETDEAGEPVAFGFEENDATFLLDPSAAFVRGTAWRGALAATRRGNACAAR